MHGGQKSVKRLSEIESEHWNTRLVHTSGHKGAVMHIWLYSTRPWEKEEEENEEVAVEEKRLTGNTAIWHHRSVTSAPNDGWCSSPWCSFQVHSKEIYTLLRSVLVVFEMSALKAEVTNVI